MKFRSCTAVYRPDLKETCWKLTEGEYCFNLQTGPGPTPGPPYTVLCCVLPEDVPGLHCIAVNIKDSIVGRPTWTWDGNIESPTLRPSIASGPKKNRIWHGYLRAGVFQACE